MRKPLREGKAHVVAIKRVRHDQLRHHGTVGFLNLHPEWQVVAVVITVVFEATEIGDQAARPRTVSAGIPTQGALARKFLQ